MKLSTKGRYGLRAVLDLAVNGKNEAVALSGIAERQDISISYLEQLIAKLKKQHRKQYQRCTGRICIG